MAQPNPASLGEQIKAKKHASYDGAIQVDKYVAHRWNALKTPLTPQAPALWLPSGKEMPGEPQEPPRSFGTLGTQNKHLPLDAMVCKMIRYDDSAAFAVAGFGSVS
ncbi:hypothetical protein PG994_015253 [Apiospora phragmitis]|uniref:Uncharacterized protein n=1 Tax=Apiospora phragmitis TaxID=2905665 RepID=A0ABR1SSC0_9PEZI